MPTATTTKLTSVDDRRAGRIMEYLSARAEWRSHNPQPEKSSNSELYESFLGPRGPAMKRKVDLICKGYLSMELLQAISFKDKGNEAFRAEDYDRATTLYTKAIVYGMPHNAVCWSNMAAAFLKLERWVEAEEAAKLAVQEHISVHGYNNGLFHVKAFHRVGRALMSQGKYEAARNYFEKISKISPEPTPTAWEVTSFLQTIQDAISHHGDDVGRQIAGRSTNCWGLSEDQVRLLSLAGVKPWEEDVSDLLYIAKGAHHVSPPCKILNNGPRVPYTPETNDAIRANICQWCHEPPRLVGFVPCLQCVPSRIEAQYCSEVCQVRDWKTHSTVCHTKPPASADRIALLFDAFLKQHLDDFYKMSFYAMGVHRGLSVLTTHAAVIHISHLNGESFLVTGIRKRTFEDLARTHGFESMSKDQSVYHEKNKKRGNVGTMMMVIIASDGTYEGGYSKTVPGIVKQEDLRDNFLPVAGWERTWIERINSSRGDWGEVC